MAARLEHMIENRSPIHNLRLNFAATVIQQAHEFGGTELQLQPLGLGLYRSASA